VYRKTYTFELVYENKFKQKPKPKYSDFIDNL